MKRIYLLLVLLFSAYLNLYSQIDKEFWFAAPEVFAHTSNFDKPIVVRLTTFGQAAAVTVSLPANPLFTRIIANIPANSSATIDLTTWIDLIENFTPDVIANKGILISSNENITAYYEVVSSYCICNPEVFALKGKNALGNEFFISSQNTYHIDTIRHPGARTSFDIVATENNTTVTILPAKPIIGHLQGQPFSIVLNKGQTYSATATYRNRENHLHGSHISSDKPIAVTLKDDLVFGDGTCADLIGDQTIPLNILGNEYIITRGYLSPQDRIFILSTENNTNIYLDGSNIPSQTLSKGETWTSNLSNNSTYIKSSEKIYVYHVTGTGCELGSAIIPKLKCTGSRSVSIVRSSGDNFTVLITTLNGNQNGFSINGNTSLIKGSDFFPVPGTNNTYVSARIDLSQSVSVNTTANISNSIGKFSLGFINGAAVGGSRYGYFSDFKASNVENSYIETCINNPTQLVAFGGSSYMWSPVNGLDDPTKSNPIASGLVSTKYKVVITDADGCIDSAFTELAVNSCITPIAGFESPDTVCINTPVSFKNTSANASSYYWNFCVANLNDPPTGQNLQNVGNQLSQPVFLDYAKFNGNYYGFSINHNPGKLVRLDFGNSLLNTPTAISLGNFSGNIPVGPGSEGIQIINNEGKWYAIIVAGYTAIGSTPRILKLEFGNDLTNTSPLVTNWGNIGNMLQPVDLHVFKEGNNWYGLTISAENNTITRFNFSNSFDNTPTAINLGNIGNLNYPTGIYAINDEGFWRVFITNGDRAAGSAASSLTRLDFGSSLLNTPTGVNLGNPGGMLHHPRDLTILKFCGQIFGFVVNGHTGYNDIVRLDFKNNLGSIPNSLSLGNIGALNFPHSISKLFRVGNDLYSFITNANNNTLTCLRFTGCSSSTLPSSIDFTPASIFYNAPGVYNINLTIDDGLPTQSSFCKQIVVLAKPQITAADISICPGNQGLLDVSVANAANLSWSPSAGLSATDIEDPIASPASSTLYTLTVSNNFCSITKDVQVTVLDATQCVPSIAAFTAPDTVCVNSPVTISNVSSNASSFLWNFCVADINSLPEAVNIGNPGNRLSLPSFIEVAFDNGKFYAFVANSSGSLVRLDFGSSMLNTPTAVNLGSFGGNYPLNAQGLQVVKAQNKWYVIAAGGNPTIGNPSRIVKIELGANIDNNTPVLTNWGNIGGLYNPMELHLFEEQGNWFGFTINSENNTITQFSFGTNFENPPTGINLGNIGNINHPAGINAINDNGFWRVFIPNSFGGTITRLDFGSSLTNIPTGVNLGNPGNILNDPRDITIIKYCSDSIVGFVMNGENSPALVRLNFNAGLGSLPTATHLGNLGNLSFPHSISKLQRIGSDLYFFVTNVRNNTITRFKIAGNCAGVSQATSTDQNPGDITYPNPGIYNISLTVNDGLPNQASFCKQVVVIPKPEITMLPEVSICPGKQVQLDVSATNSTTFSWSPATGLSATDIEDPVASPASSTLYTLTASNNFCGATKDVQVTVLDASQCIPSVAAFAAPDTVCINSPVTITNSSTNASSYLWNFCIADVKTTPAGTNLGNPGGNFARPVFMDYAYENGVYYGFMVNNSPGGLVKLDFGNSISNTPISTYLGNFGGKISNSSQGIQLVKQNNRWIAIIVGGDPLDGTASRVLKVDFGTNLNNIPVVTNWGNIGNLNYPTDLYVFKDGNEWHGLTVNYNSSTITRFDFGTDFSSTPTGLNIGSPGNLNSPSGICPINDNGTWRIFVTNYGNHTLSRLDFGNSLLNNPTTSVNLGNVGGVLNNPRDLYILNYCSEKVGFLINGGNSNLVRLDFLDLSLSPSATSLGNIGNLSTPHSISKLTRIGSDLVGFIQNAYQNTFSQVVFKGSCISTNISTSTQSDPPAITYSAPGIYNINLLVNEGLPNESSFCKQVVVRSKPSIIPMDDIPTCPANKVLLDAVVSGATKYSWSPAAGLSDATIVNPEASPGITTKYTLTASNGGCSADASVTVTILSAAECTPDPCNETYQKLYGGSKADIATGIVHNTDGTSVIAGYSSSFGSGGNDGYLQKIDKKGNDVWSVAVGGPGNESFQSLAITSDGGYIAAGSSTSYGGSANGIAWIVKVDADGVLQWSRKYDDGNANGSIAMDIIQTSDGGYAISGTNRFTPGLANAMVIKTDNNGLVKWAKSYDSDNSDQSFGLVEEGDSLVISAFQYGQGSSLYNGVIMKLSQANGNMGWARNYDIDNRSNWFRKIYKTTGGYRVNVYNDVAFSITTPEQIIINTDKNGVPRNLYKVSGNPTRSIGAYAPTNDGGFVVTQTDKDNSADIHLIKSSRTGVLEWAKKISGPGIQVISDLRQLADGSYIMAGYNNSTPSIGDSADIFIIKTDQLGNTLSCIPGNTNATITTPAYTVNISYNWSGVADISFGPINVTSIASAAVPLKRVLCEGPVPAPDFNFTQDLCNPKSIQFTSFDLINQLDWDFGNGNPLNHTISPNIVYNELGAYYVKLKATSPAGCTDSITKPVSAIIALNRMISARDTSACFTGNFQLNALPALNYCWSPATGLSSTTIANPVITSLMPRTTYWLNALVTGTNLVTNGDFSQGNTGFESEYTSRTGTIIVGEYLVDNNPKIGNVLFSPCTDHTDGSGKMMIVDGSPVVNSKVWKQTIVIKPNTNYAFSCWIQSIYPTNPSKLQFYINGIIVGNVINAGTTTCTWQQFYTQWNSGKAANVEIAIVNQNTVQGGNDFALDDISFGELQIVRDSVNVTINANPEIDFNYNIPFCKSVQMTGMEISGPSPIADWNWNFGDDLSASASALTHTYKTGGKYTIKVVATDMNTCKDSTDKIIQLDTIIAVVSPDTLVCKNAPVTLRASGGTIYEWSPVNFMINAQDAEPVINIDKTTRFYLKVKNGIGCEDTDSVLVSIKPRPSFVRPQNRAVCADSTVELKGNNGNLHKYAWSPSSTLDDPAAMNPMATPGNTTSRYQVTITEDPCGYDTTFEITVIVNPNPTVTVSSQRDIDCINPTTRLVAEGTGLKYEWFPAYGVDFPTSSNVIGSVDSTTTFIIKNTNQFNCSAYDSVIVKVTNTAKPVFVLPNAFTPNRDGNNDCFGIKHWGNVTIHEFSIFNRWGERVFTTKNPRDCWDGTYKGQLQPSGGYVYTIRARSFCGEMIRKGSLILVR